tara:strand:+ start:5246 stop:6097 length:852 start_codon:yes stop_codon:yes gene_type:complete
MCNSRLANKVAIITGSGRRSSGEIGLGYATAIKMATHGANVIVADISDENAHRTVSAISSEGYIAEAFIGDLTNTDAIRRMVEQADKSYGGLDILVNNLGYFAPRDKARPRGVTGLTKDGFYEAVEHNLASAVFASRHAIPSMIKSGGGSIINVSSIDGISAARSYSVDYGVTKGALHMLTKTTAAFHGRDGIRCNCIAPGHVKASFVDDISDDLHERRRKVAPLGTEGTPWDVANLAVFLASDESRWISGVTIPVDGGLMSEQPLLGQEFVNDMNLTADKRS